jgi:nitrite reductase/ring-hydroxylating ferredoxin subunit
MGSSLVMAGLPGLCCTTEEASAASFTISGSTLTIDLSLARTLARPGGAMKVIDMARRINLIVVQPEHGKFEALERSCTHGGAQVIYNRRNKTVQCTSWGHSEFALDGAVLGGSARMPLRTYPTQRVGNHLWIDLSGGAA